MNSPATQTVNHAARMDEIYGVQRHFYDLTRKYYLLGRDRLIRELALQDEQRVLEIGCGTGRNLAALARRYPLAQLYGLDISSQMLKSAHSALARANAAERSHLALGDASQFDAQSLFGITKFDRIFASYTLSLIPDWQAAINAGLRALAPGGAMHIVDFGQQADLPRWFARGLHGWLAKFDVTPRRELMTYCEDLAYTAGIRCDSARLYRDYSWIITLSH